MGALQDKVAIVTASGGINREICRAFAIEGAKVVVLDIDESAAIDAVVEMESLGAQAMALRCDASATDEIMRAVKDAVDWFGSVDILVNGILPMSRDVALEDMTDADVDWALNHGPASALKFMRACHPYLADGGGHVINLHSDDDFAHVPTSAGREWGWDGITVNSLSTSGIHDGSPTPMSELDALITSLSSTAGRNTETGIGIAILPDPMPRSSRVAS